MDHHTTIHQAGEGSVQAICSCGWRSPVYGADKAAGTMDPLQRAADAGDLHEWEMSLRRGGLHRSRSSTKISPPSSRSPMRPRAGSGPPWTPCGEPQTTLAPAGLTSRRRRERAGRAPCSETGGARADSMGSVDLAGAAHRVLAS